MERDDQDDKKIISGSKILELSEKDKPSMTASQYERMKKKSYNIARRINNNFASSAEIRQSSDPYNQRIHSRDFDLNPVKE